ncbi:hypothetical protein GBA52_011767 [Prunus armeniaca]|nr:hypothetical protein GBA52_011767 [Prunus armeniaca]
MFYSQCLLSRKGPLGAIWVAAYSFKKLKKAQVTQTDISSSVDKILQDEWDVVAYRVLAYLLLGVVRIYSKKVEYLFNDCNEVLIKINKFVVSTKRMQMQTSCGCLITLLLYRIDLNLMLLIWGSLKLKMSVGKLCSLKTL